MRPRRAIGIDGVMPLWGTATLLAGLFCWLLGAHYRGRRYFDRPPIARNRFFDPVLAVLRWLLIPAGLVLLTAGSPVAGASATLLLAAVIAYRFGIRSIIFRRWLMRREFRALQRRHPGLPAREILLRMLLERHPRWGEELIEQMVGDNPDIDALARIVARMERGYRGFG